MTTQKLIVILAFIVAVGVVFYFQTPQPDGGDIAIASFEECVTAGNPVMESYPEWCRTEDGKTFVRDIGNELEMKNLVRIETPRPGQSVASPLEIHGEARGFWYFEGSFPIKLIDNDGNVLAVAIATAQGE